jgi:LmbE family N-acetylglucosaminyl deacetylase
VTDYGGNRLLRLEAPEGRGGHRVLALGAHSDDLEIGCGGTILRLAAAGLLADAWWIVLSGDQARAEEAKAGADAFLEGVPRSTVLMRDFRDGFFPYVGGELKGFFEELKHQVQPDVIFTPRREDFHQDHRLVSELTWNTFRNHLILEYEVPKYDGDLRSPNVFVELSEELCRRKVDTLVGAFASQAHRAWFTPDVFWSLLRLRGLEANAASGYAEGFQCRKLVL